MMKTTTIAAALLLGAALPAFAENHEGPGDKMHEDDMAEETMSDDVMMEEDSMSGDEMADDDMMAEEEMSDGMSEADAVMEDDTDEKSGDMMKPEDS